MKTTLALARRAGLWAGHVDDVMPVKFSPRYEPSDRFLSVGEVQAVIAKLPPDRGGWVALAVGAGAELSALERAQQCDWDGGNIVHIRGIKNERRNRHGALMLDICRNLL